MKFALPFCLVIGSLSAPALAAPAKVGEAAPDFTITTLDHRKISLADLHGKVVVLNYWATWCGPCKTEMPLLGAFRKKFADAGLEIYSITVDDKDIRRKYLLDLEKALSFPLATSLRSKSYGILTGVPTNYIIDRAGKLRYAKAGSLDLQSLNQELIPLLREPAPAP